MKIRTSLEIKKLKAVMDYITMDDQSDFLISQEWYEAEIEKCRKQAVDDIKLKIAADPKIPKGMSFRHYMEYFDLRRPKPPGINVKELYPINGKPLDLMGCTLPQFNYIVERFGCDIVRQDDRDYLTWLDLLNEFDKLDTPFGDRLRKWNIIAESICAAYNVYLTYE